LEQCGTLVLSKYDIVLKKKTMQSYIFRNKMDIYFLPKHQIMKILETTLFKLVAIKYFIMII